jgi:hypothetical protein
MNLPRSVPPAEAGAQCMGGWIGPDGRFWPAAYGEHIAVGVLLGRWADGPRLQGRVDLRGWVQVRADGEAVILSLTQAQRDALGDMLAAAPASTWRGHLARCLRRHDQPEAARPARQDETARCWSEVLRYLQASGRTAEGLQALRGTRTGG